MPIFRNNNGNLEQIKETYFDLEKKIQKITEENLAKIFNLEFVKSEFRVTKGSRIDTLAFDQEYSSFVIIEYKKDEFSGLFDQGLAYLEIMLNRKADFIIEYNESLDKSLKKRDVDWSQSKIIFVSPYFNKNQKQAVNLDLHIELWQVNSYQNDIVEYFLIQTNETETPMKILGSKGSTINKITSEIITYDEEYHFQIHGSDKTKELYYEIKNRIISFGNNIELKFHKNYIGFNTKSRFVNIFLKRNKIDIEIFLKINEIQDPKNVLVDLGNKGRNNMSFSGITVRNKTEIPYMMGLVEQSYTKSIKK